MEETIQNLVWLLLRLSQHIMESVSRSIHIRKFSRNQINWQFLSNSKAKAASGRFSFEWGYNQTCHWFHNLRAAIPKLHAKFGAILEKNADMIMTLCDFNKDICTLHNTMLKRTIWRNSALWNDITTDTYLFKFNYCVSFS